MADNMSGPTPTILPLSPAITQEMLEDSHQAYTIDEVRKALLDILSDLLGVDEASTFFGPMADDPLAVSLKSLYTRLATGRLALSPLPSQSRNPKWVKENAKKKTGKAPTVRPLEDFEDLYYAMLAHIKDMYQLLGTRLSNGFNSPSTPIYPDSHITFADFLVWLGTQWSVLNDPALVRTLDEAVRRSRVKHIHQEVLSRIHSGVLTKEEGDSIAGKLYLSGEYKAVQGIWYVADWNPAMISAWLGEKYHIVFCVEKEVRDKKRRSLIRRASLEKMKKSNKLDMKAVAGANLTTKDNAVLTKYHDEFRSSSKVRHRRRRSSGSQKHSVYTVASSEQYGHVVPVQHHHGMAGNQHHEESMVGVEYHTEGTRHAEQQHGDMSQSQYQNNTVKDQQHHGYVEAAEPSVPGYSIDHPQYPVSTEASEPQEHHSPGPQQRSYQYDTPQKHDQHGSHNQHPAVHQTPPSFPAYQTQLGSEGFRQRLQSQAYQQEQTRLRAMQQKGGGVAQPESQNTCSTNLDMQMRMQRVSQYTQYLRKVASPIAKRVIDETSRNAQRALQGRCGGVEEERERMQQRFEEDDEDDEDNKGNEDNEVDEDNEMDVDDHM